MLLQRQRLLSRPRWLLDSSWQRRGGAHRTAAFFVHDIPSPFLPGLLTDLARDRIFRQVDIIGRNTGALLVEWWSSRRTVSFGVGVGNRRRLVVWVFLLRTGLCVLNRARIMRRLVVSARSERILRVIKRFRVLLTRGRTLKSVTLLRSPPPVVVSCSPGQWKAVEPKMCKGKISV